VPRISLPARLEDRRLVFQFDSTPGAEFTVLASTNLFIPLSDWERLGAPVELTPGQYRFADPFLPDRAQRFYLLRSP
jgi:hypothetical protein